MNGARVVGLVELRRRLDQVDDAVLDEPLEAAAAALARTARPPRRSGRLDRSLRADGPAVVSSLPYAGVIHFGYPRRHIDAQPFVLDAWDTAGAAIDDAAADALDRTLDHY